MKKLSDVLISRQEGKLSFWCPGCQEEHQINYGETGGPQWSWNGNEVKPTFTPSVLVRSGHYAGGKEGEGCWCTYNKQHPEDANMFCNRCHTYVTDGRIRFLSDCSHALAGQTVDMVPFPKREDLHA